MALDLNATAATFFAHFGEAAMVYPPDESEPYEVVAVVNRGDPTAPWTDGQVAPSTVVSLRNSETLGVPGDSFDPTTWRIGIATQVGQELVARRVRRLISQDMAVIEVEMM